ncbi:MAG: response regulator [Elusimicrobia bacterium]|nr:response regulator [Elusimicrobiota bacterium]
MKKPLRAIVVDDNLAMRMVLRDMLEGSGHQVVAEAENQDEALKAYAEHKPDLVTLDLSLAQGDGLSVLKALRQLDANARVIVISGNSQKKVVELVKAAGAADFLAKPFKIEELAAVVERAAGA